MQLSSCKIGVLSLCEQDVQLVLVPKHVWQVELHVRHEPSPSEELRYCPSAHVEMQVPATVSKVAPSTHDVHAVAVASLQVAQDASQSAQVILPSANWPAGQLATQAPLSKYGVPDVGHVRHAELLAAEHVSHEAWQAVHRPSEPMASTNVPGVGHPATQVLPERKGEAAFVQLKQSELEGPLQVPQVESQSTQTPLLLAHLPEGVHDARHPPA